MTAGGMHVGASIKVSVIVPTYNRAGLLQTTLTALEQQTYPASLMEIWVVDDGSTEDMSVAVSHAQGTIAIQFVRQPNAGATAARNNGALQAKGDILIFADDDIELMPEAVFELVASLAPLSHAVVVGTLLASDELESTGGSLAKSNEALISIPIGKCFTGLLAVRRIDFLELGMFQDPAGGWPNWDDVDFGYRAHRAGYALWRSGKAQAVHHDMAALSLEAASARWYRAGRSAVRLFQKHPGIYKQLPMFEDKTPIRWGKESLRLVVRKLARRMTAAAPALGLLNLFANAPTLEQLFPYLTNTAKRWIVGGRVFQGVQQGIKEYGDFPE